MNFPKRSSRTILSRSDRRRACTFRSDGPSRGLPARVWKSTRNSRCPMDRRWSIAGRFLCEKPQPWAHRLGHHARSILLSVYGHFPRVGILMDPTPWPQAWYSANYLGLSRNCWWHSVHAERMDFQLTPRASRCSGVSAPKVPVELGLSILWTLRAASWDSLSRSRKVPG